jgi:sodium transport system ATP-binding protein
MIEVRGLAKQLRDARGRHRAGLSLQAAAAAHRQGRAGRLLPRSRRPHHRACSGPNGAGKTTTLRMLGRADRARRRPHGGRRQSTVVARPRETLARMGVLSDARGLYPRLTARENIVYYGALQGCRATRRTARAESLARHARDDAPAGPPHRRLQPGRAHEDGAGPRAGARPRQHRAGRAHQRAWTCWPRAPLRDALRWLRTPEGGGKCIVFSTHIMQEVERLCDSVVVVAHGRTVASGSVGALLAQTGERDFEEAFVKLAFAEEQARSARRARMKRVATWLASALVGLPQGDGRCAARPAHAGRRVRVQRAHGARSCSSRCRPSSPRSRSAPRSARWWWPASSTRPSSQLLERQTYTVKPRPADYERAAQLQLGDPVVVCRRTSRPRCCAATRRW